MTDDVRRTDVSLGYLRGFVTLMVVAHHAMLAYHPFAPPPAASLAASPWWRAFPIVDTDRYAGFAIPVAFNDNFFMSLMFLLSGLFVWRSLERKGAARFLRDRALRLGIPLLVSLIVLAPLAYFPAYLQSGGSGVIGFARDYTALATLPLGPAWFLWVLLAFDVLVAGYFALVRRLPVAPRRPIVAFVVLVALSAAAYIPLGRAVGELGWDGIGPFQVQIGRVAHYALYFGAGVIVGAQLERSFISALARWWLAWVVLAGVAFYIAIGWETAAMLGLASPIKADVGFVLTCAASSFGMLALFVRFAGRAVPALDSLRANAYGIYLLHYAAVTWLQYSLLDAALPGVVKGLLVTAAAIAISWTVSATLRRARPIARIV
jgi:peptidoglycan/LPS O-acetylase OafA/YrhL